MPFPVERLSPEHPEIVALQQRGAIGALGIVYDTRWARLRVDPVRFPAGHVGTQVVYALPTAPEGEPVGAVVLAVRPGARGAELLVQWQWRHCVQGWSLEAPRGGVSPSDASPVATGLRELAEETGAAAPLRTQRLGDVAADTGRMSDRNAVLAAWYPPARGAEHESVLTPAAPDAEESLLAAQWVPVVEYLPMASVSPRAGEPVAPLCGVTLSAVALLALTQAPGAASWALGSDEEDAGAERALPHMLAMRSRAVGSSPGS